MNDKDEVVSLYNRTCAEITRYRDREWRNQGIFTASIVAIIGFILAHPTSASKVYYVFDCILVILALGNVFYTGYAHTKLTEQRNILCRLQKKFEFDKLKIDNTPILPSKWFEDNLHSKCFHYGWTRGFWSHLLPFWLFDSILVVVGIFFVHSQVLVCLTP